MNLRGPTAFKFFWNYFLCVFKCNANAVRKDTNTEEYIKKVLLGSIVFVASVTIIYYFNFIFYNLFKLQ